MTKIQFFGGRLKKNLWGQSERRIGFFENSPSAYIHERVEDNIQIQRTVLPYAGNKSDLEIGQAHCIMPMSIAP